MFIAKLYETGKMYKPQTVGFRYDIQGLRGLSILLVIFSYTSYPILSKGYIGVDIFFVISGFLITQLLIQEYETTGRIKFRNFYAKRIKRILPAASIVILAVLAISTLIYRQEGSIITYVESIWASLFLSNYYYASSGTDYFNHETVFILQNYWSLAVEEQIYIVFPLLLLLVMFLLKTRTKVAIFFAIITIVSLLYSFYEITTNPSYAYYSTLSRVWQFSLGCLTAIMAPSIIARLNMKLSKLFAYIGVSLILASLFILEIAPFNSLYLAFIPSFATVLILASDNKGQPFYNLLNNRLFVWLGSISFSLYLWFWPIYVFYTNSQVELPGFLGTITVTIIAILLAWLTTKYIENPIRKNSTLSENPIKTIILGISTILFTVTLPILLILTSPTIQQVSKEISKPETIQELQETIATNVKNPTPYNSETIPQLYELNKNASDLEQYKCINKEETSSELNKNCLYGDRESENTLAVFGDSQAAMWIPVLDIIGKQSDFKVLLLAKTGCPPIAKTTYSNVLMKPSTECDSFKEKAMEIIKTDPEIQTVILAGLTIDKYVTDENQQPITDEKLNLKEWETGYNLTIQELKNYGVKPIIITSTPTLKTSPKTCISANTENVNLCSTTINSKTSTINMEKKVATSNQIRYIDTEQLFCYKTECPVIINNHIVYQDQFHITGTYMQNILYPFTELLYNAVMEPAKPSQADN